MRTLLSSCNALLLRRLTFELNRYVLQLQLLNRALITLQTYVQMHLTPFEMKSPFSVKVIRDSCISLSLCNFHLNKPDSPVFEFSFLLLLNDL